MERGLDMAAQPVINFTLQQGQPKAIVQRRLDRRAVLSRQPNVKLSSSIDHCTLTLPSVFDKAPYLAALVASSWMAILRESPVADLV